MHAPFLLSDPLYATFLEYGECAQSILILLCAHIVHTLCTLQAPNMTTPIFLCLVSDCLGIIYMWLVVMLVIN